MSYIQLTPKERYVIHHLKLYGLSYREIGRRLGRHHSTISREVLRNGPTFPGWVYRDDMAQESTVARRSQVRHNRKYDHLPLLTYVERKLAADWSPEEISGRLKLDYPDDDEMRVSPEAVYQWVYRDAMSGGTLYGHLRRMHQKRRKQRHYGSLRSLIPGRASIHERPTMVDSRKRFGDWEGDSVIGSAQERNALTSQVERKSRYLIVKKLTDRTAQTFAQKVTQAFKRIPKQFRKTLTLDNGKEGSRFHEIEDRTGILVYFADPYASWQRGTNENTNGLLRQYFPKGSDFRKITQTDVTRAVKKLNHRPRKCLHYRTPHEVFFEAIRGAVAS